MPYGVLRNGIVTFLGIENTLEDVRLGTDIFRLAHFQSPSSQTTQLCS